MTHLFMNGVEHPRTTESILRTIQRYTVVRDSGCIEWVGTKNRTGYGRLAVDTKGDCWRVAHRVVYELQVGPIQVGLELDHLCKNRPCVNPAHLEPVTKRENWERGLCPSLVNREKEFCLRGHVFDEANTRIEGTRRQCRACQRDRARARKARERRELEGQ